MIGLTQEQYRTLENGGAGAIMDKFDLQPNGNETKYDALCRYLSNPSNISKDSNITVDQLKAAVEPYITQQNPSWLN